MLTAVVPSSDVRRYPSVSYRNNESEIHDCMRKYVY